MPRTQQSYAPFGGINTAVSKTDEYDGRLLDAQGVYHREVGRLHPVCEGQELAANADHEVAHSTGTIAGLMIRPSGLWQGLDAMATLPATGKYPVDYRYAAGQYAAGPYSLRVYEQPYTYAELTSQTNGITRDLSWYGGWGNYTALSVTAQAQTIKSILGSFGATLAAVTSTNWAVTAKIGEEDASGIAHLAAYTSRVAGKSNLIQLTALNSTTQVTRIVRAILSPASTPGIIGQYQIDTLDADSAAAVAYILGLSSDVIVDVLAPLPANMIDIGDGYTLVWQDGQPARVYTYAGINSFPSDLSERVLNTRYIQGKLGNANKCHYLLPRDTATSVAATISRTAGKTLTSTVAISSTVPRLIQLYTLTGERNVRHLLDTTVYGEQSGAATYTLDIDVQAVSGVWYQAAPIWDAKHFRAATVHNKQLVGLEGAHYKVIPAPTTATVSAAAGVLTYNAAALTWLTANRRDGDSVVLVRSLAAPNNYSPGENLRSLNALDVDDAITQSTVAASTFGLVRPLTQTERNRLHFAGTPVDTANGIPEDATNWADYNTPSLEIGDPQDGLATGLLSVDDSRLLVFFEGAIWEVSGTLPLGNVVPADLNVRKLSVASGASSYEAVDHDRASQTIYYAGRRGVYRMGGNTVEQLDTTIRNHSEYPADWTHVRFAGDKVYCAYVPVINSNDDAVIWIYDTRAEAWTYTKRKAFDPAFGAVINLNTWGHGGIGSSSDQRRALVMSQDLARANLPTYPAVINTETLPTAVKYYHVGKVRVPLTDLSTVGDKRIVKIKWYTAQPVDTAGTADQLAVSVIGEGMVTSTRQVEPDRDDNGAAIYVAGGATGRGATSVGVQVGDGTRTIPELRELWVDIQQMGGHGGRA